MLEIPLVQGNLQAPSRRHLGKAALAGLGTLAVAAPVSHAASSDIRAVSAEYRAADAQRLLDLINSYRSQNGLGSLRHSATVAAVMDSEVQRQFNQGVFSHGTQFLNHPNVQSYSFVREVIALSYNDDISQLLAFWKSSPAHKAAVLAPSANTCGIGLCYGKGGSFPWRVLGNMGIYRYDNSGPSDIQTTVAGAAASEAFTVRGGIGAQYYRGGGAAAYGNPTMNESGGLVDGGVYQVFQKDRLRYKFLWSPATGTQVVYENGAIGRTFSRGGFENNFGYPTSGEYWDGVYVRQNFSSGRVISWNSTNGSVSVN